MPGSIAHQILVVASGTPLHWYELEGLANHRGRRLYDRPSITAALKLLANHGFLTRRQGQFDGNVQLYTLTLQGEGLRDELRVEEGE